MTHQANREADLENIVPSDRERERVQFGSEISAAAKNSSAGVWPIAK